jgi:hypothetical protein
MTKRPFVLPQNADFAVSQARFVMPEREVRFSAFGLTNRGGAGLCACTFYPADFSFLPGLFLASLLSSSMAAKRPSSCFRAVHYAVTLRR